MMKTALKTVVVCWAVMTAGQAKGQEALRIATDLALVPASLVSDAERLATLGDKAVVTNESASNYESPSRVWGERILVVENSRTGRLGTTDGGIVVRLHSSTSLDGLSADYGLTVKHAFTAQPAAVLLPEDPEVADAYVAKLREDDRVVSAELNVNFYQEQAN
jgi:hypothetical protein